MKNMGHTADSMRFLIECKKVTLWYQHEPHDYGCEPVYNHLENGWSTQDKPDIASQQQHWWNNRNWSKKLAYLRNEVVTYENQK